MKKFLAAVAVAAIAVSAPAYAATQGTLSQTSSLGTLDFTTTIPNMVRVSNLSDITLNVTAAALNNQFFSRQDASTQFCVYSNIGAEGNYNITIGGDAGTANPFALTNTATASKLDYNIWVSDDITNEFRGGNGYAFPNVQKTGFKTTATPGKARPTDTTCSNVGGVNASLHVGVDNARILAATAGSYKGTLTVTVSTI